MILTRVVYIGKLIFDYFCPQAVEDRTTASFKICKYIIGYRLNPSSKSLAYRSSVNKFYYSNVDHLNVAALYSKSSYIMTFHFIRTTSFFDKSEGQKNYFNRQILQ